LLSFSNYRGSSYCDSTVYTIFYNNCKPSWLDQFTQYTQCMRVKNFNITGIYSSFNVSKTKTCYNYNNYTKKNVCIYARFYCYIFEKFVGNCT